MSIFNEPAFQSLVKLAKLRRVLSLLRCVYAWVFLLGPMALLNKVIDQLSVAALWAYLVGTLAAFIFGASLWVRGTNGIFAPVHGPLKRFLKKPTEDGLRRICAEMVSQSKDKRYPKPDYDLMRRAHTIAARNTAIISRELFEFYTTILRTCGVAGV